MLDIQNYILEFLSCMSVLYVLYLQYFEWNGVPNTLPPSPLEFQLYM